MHVWLCASKQCQPQEARVGMGVKAGGSMNVDSERKMFEMRFKRSH